MDPSHGEITRLLDELKCGHKEAVEKLMPLVYTELRKIARRRLRRERGDHTLQPTALVHEAYLKLVGQDDANWQGRAHFFAVAAQVMRRILVDHARGHKADKRWGKVERLPLDDQVFADERFYPQIVILNEALDRLQKHDLRQCQIVEMRFFGGFSEEEIAEVVGISVRTVKRDWKVARAWLHREMMK